MYRFFGCIVASLSVIHLAYAQQCSSDDEGSCSAPGLRLDKEALKWKPATITVVLPCAGEEMFAKKTVASVVKSFGDDIDALAEIVVVDDGSEPPLKTIFKKTFAEKHKVKLVRHKTTQGLIRAKSSGASQATGDLIVFYDCHVAPQPGWHKLFLESSAENYRRIVVPSITDLDIDRWEERTRQAPPVSKCYLTFDADFKWFEATSMHIPVLSGGLLGISSRWWNETEGYDHAMLGWGGENIDQSVRTWLCGGEILALPAARVAHMWRTPNDPRTQAKYKQNPYQSIQNRLRAAVGWFGNFSQKLHHFPDMGRMLSKNPPDISTFDKVRNKLQCRPFSWFLWRFRDIYINAGLVPPKTFLIRHIKSGKCLTYMGPAGTHPGGADKVSLLPCGELPQGRYGSSNPHAQRWQIANKDFKSGECCSGLRVWNSDQCLTGRQQVSTTVCDISGKRQEQWFSFTASGDAKADAGQLSFVNGYQCVKKKKGDLTWGPCKTSGWVSSGEGATWELAEEEIPIEKTLYEQSLLDLPDMLTE
mmetsp:Transcript_25468/g.59292  ORF Transcript_25468/g.59292 Transcript_25468/m.59292 type:complete len:533 (+) Transcript_25468:144-1742(+)|eukprot:CAMPEP_0178404798 /NCGR_PEP_ID=MMETSP0689_2-20121128/18073_1 /TAXON_ID=160604 /ORGANISM="Amphidinium massartii, Strain CS-259" /LENGTH=532 /DNA_ID=CAMNT_0020025801 /DNA_START=134 /DNA_END=1732 /DNA_ORIENTATION=+